MTIDDDELSVADRDALERALALAQAEGQGRRRQLQQMLEEDGWFSAAHFAAYHCQTHTLRLKPWMSPPCYGHLDGDTGAAALLQRLLAHGLSRYEPDPVHALQTIEARAHGELPPAAA